MNFLNLTLSTLRQVDHVNVPTTLVGATGVVLKAMDYVNWTCEDIHSKTKWSWAEDLKTITTVANTGTYSLPSTIDYDSVGPLMLPASGKALQYVDYEDWYREYGSFVTNSTTPPDELPSTPLKYTIFNNYVYLIPVPDSVYSIDYPCQLLHVTMTGNTDTPLIPAQYHKTIVWGASEMLADYLGDTEAAKKFQDRYNRDLSQMLSNNRRFRDRNPGMRPEL